VQRVNPEVHVTGHPQALTRASYDQERAAVTGTVGAGAARSPGTAVLFDCVDSLASRRELDRIHRDRALPVFHGAVQEWWGQAATLLPGGGGYAAIYGRRWEPAEVEEPGGQPIMAHVVTTIASAQVAEFVRWLESPEHASLSAHLWYYDGRSLSGTRLQLGGTSG
jgi:adenylyltransferase/sulfurtransferase